MILTTITQSDITDKPLYYSRWHSCSSTERGRHYDISVGGLVGPILSMGTDTFIISTYLTYLVTLDDNYTTTELGFKVWNVSTGTMYLEDNNGIRYFGAIESLTDLGDEGLKVCGTSCLFTDNLDEAYVKSFFSIRELIPKDTDPSEDGRDYQDAIDHVRKFEPLIREYYPEKFI